MTDTRRGKKLLNVRNFGSYTDWMKRKKEGRPKQQWIKYTPEEDGQSGGYWEKVNLES